MAATSSKCMSALAAAALVGALAGPTRADPAPARAAESPRRDVPDYSGRGPEPTTAGDVALWVPRVILSPLYFVSEYVLRRPLGVVVSEAERIDLPRKAYDFFTFGPEHDAGILPVGFYDFDFNPSVGVYAFWDDAGFKGTHLAVHVEAWPADWIAGSISERFRFDTTHMLQLRAEAVRRPDRVFYGIGPSTLQSYQSRYGSDRVEASGSYEWRFWRSSYVQLATGFRSETTRPGHYGDDPGVDREAATGAYALPYGFGRTDAVPYGRLSVALDTRRPLSPGGAGPVSGSGVRVELQADPAGDLRAPRAAWIKYRANAGGFIDLNNYERVLSVSASVLFADSLSSSQAIPFTELTTLGGDGAMRAFYAGRLVDRSAFTTTAHYVWPIGAWLSGTLQAGVGNVFDGHLEGFRPGLLRFGGSLGISTRAVTDYPVEFIFGVGSETFEHGATIDAFRVTLSANRGGF